MKLHIALFVIGFAAGAATKDFLSRQIQKGLRWLADRI